MEVPPPANAGSAALLRVLTHALEECQQQNAALRRKNAENEARQAEVQERERVVEEREREFDEHVLEFKQRAEGIRAEMEMLTGERDVLAQARDEALKVRDQALQAVYQRDSDVTAVNDAFYTLLLEHEDLKKVRGGRREISRTGPCVATALRWRGTAVAGRGASIRLRAEAAEHANREAQSKLDIAVKELAAAKASLEGFKLESKDAGPQSHWHSRNVDEPSIPQAIVRDNDRRNPVPPASSIVQPTGNHGVPPLPQALRPQAIKQECLPRDLLGELASENPAPYVAKPEVHAAVVETDHTSMPRPGEPELPSIAFISEPNDQDDMDMKVAFPPTRYVGCALIKYCKSETMSISPPAGRLGKVSILPNSMDHPLLCQIDMLRDSPVRDYAPLAMPVATASAPLVLVNKIGRHLAVGLPNKPLPMDTAEQSSVRGASSSQAQILRTPVDLPNRPATLPVNKLQKPPGLPNKPLPPTQHRVAPSTTPTVERKMYLEFMAPFLRPTTRQPFNKNIAPVAGNNYQTMTMLRSLVSPHLHLGVLLTLCDPQEKRTCRPQLYLPHRTQWCTAEKLHALCFAPTMVYDQATGDWSADTSLRRLCGERVDFFVLEKSDLYYAGIYVVHDMRGLHPPGSVLPRDISFKAVMRAMGLERPRSAGAYTNELLTDKLLEVYPDRRPRTECFGLQCVGFDAELYQNLRDRLGGRGQGPIGQGPPLSVQVTRVASAGYDRSRDDGDGGGGMPDGQREAKRQRR
ncbi:hypothetical protein MIND_01341400 [Mycena indigotica]|uniref:Uncharacterized protein n=1 Tax=Mycena indigotica TaxID=2126181 RepID=A0A8H6S1G1_9AGAR|nr:uncharacterized protein MIND_01341400 [Mycena indigotica]KAF7290276.1 hypothetical protein MIND_01341400 [Mycena indigotica]